MTDTLEQLVARLAFPHARTSIVIDAGRPEEVTHTEDALLKLIRECVISGIGRGNGKTQPGFSIPLSKDGEIERIYAARVEEINIEYLKLPKPKNYDAPIHEYPELRLLKWAKWYRQSDHTAGEYAAVLEWLHDMTAEFDGILNPHAERELSEPCPQCGRDHVTADVAGERIRRRALVVTYDDADVNGTAQLACRHCGALARGQLAVTLAVESLTPPGETI